METHAPVIACAHYPLITPAVERVMAWHREHSLRRARAAMEAIHVDDGVPTTESTAASGPDLGGPLRAEPR